MQKTNNNYKTYKAISSGQAKLLQATEQFPVFSLSLLQKKTGWKRTTISNLLHALKKKNIITAVRKNKYVVNETIPENLFLIATQVVSPSYLSFWTAASYYGWTEQQVSALQLVSPKQFPSLKLQNHTIETITLLPAKFFGYLRIGNFPIAEKEKLIIEMLYKPELCGGMNEVKKCFQYAWNQINEERLYKYLLRFNNKSCCARLGYLLEELQLRNNLEKKLLRCLPRGYVKLHPRKKNTGKYNKKWGVVIND